MEPEYQNLDRISTLPQEITVYILTLIPIRDALRTSVLSKKWRYCWRSMPKLVFTDSMIKVLDNFSVFLQLKKYKLVNAIFHVLLFHTGPTILEFNFSGVLGMYAIFDQIISYVSGLNGLKELIFIIDDDDFYDIPSYFFSFQGLERVHLKNCDIAVVPSTYKGFSMLRRMSFTNVVVHGQVLHQFLSGCPLLEEVILGGYEEDVDFSRGNAFSFVDLLQYVPLIKILGISKYYMKYLCAGGMPYNLSTSLVHLKRLRFEVCFMEQDELSWVFFILRSSPMLEEISFLMHYNEELQETPINFLDSQGHSDLNLNHLKVMQIEMFRNLPVEMDFVKLIMAKSPVLKKVRIELSDELSVDGELKMFRDLVLLPFPRASQSAKLIIERSKTY